MKEILLTIEEKRKRLEQSQFCQWLSSNSHEGEDPLAFTPAMLFFVLGFKDILSSLDIKNPQTPIEIQISTHCKEDLDHWKWYLHDLEKSGFELNSWGGLVTDVFKKVWADENQPTRSLVYTTISFIKQSRDPLLNLVIIEVLEAAFRTFIAHMNVPTKRAQVYNRLHYFGKTHNDKEMAHSLKMGTEESHHENDLENYEISDHSRRLALSIIDELFRGFDEVFNCWYVSRNVYKREQPAAKSLTFIDEELAQAKELSQLNLV